MFTHVILTRFNMATPGRELAIRTKPGWLADRFALFEDYCLPSIAAQTRRDFRWMVYFDKDTPDEFKERVERLRGVFPFDAYYTGLFLTPGWRQSIAQTIAPETPLILTTHFDNDDALARDHVERLHASVVANGCRQGGYNFENGLVRAGDRVYALRHRSNAFFSWLEPFGPETRTVSSIPHMRMADLGDVHQIGGAPAWMQLVHGTNVSNRVRGKRLGNEAPLGLFAGRGGEPVADPGLRDQIVENLVLRYGRDLRDLATIAFNRLRSRR